MLVCGEEETAMVDLAPAPFTVCYEVRNIPAVSRVLRGLPEFARGAFRPDLEEFVWRVPQGDATRMNFESVATVRLGGNKLQIECRSRHVLSAMQVLVDSLVGPHLTQRPGLRSVAAGM